tara:strand:- start:423 stop:860 length:438 start_codon:yes stop_codon:yes gene_type:complete
MKTKKNRVGNIGLRLETNNPNLLENYTKYRKNRTPKKKNKKKNKKKKKKSTVRKIVVQKKIDPLLKIIEDTDKKEVKDDLIIEEKNVQIEDNKVEDNKVKDNKVKDNKMKDNKVKDNNNSQIKSIKITGSMKPDKEKTGAGDFII